MRYERKNKLTGVYEWEAPTELGAAGSADDAVFIKVLATKPSSHSYFNALRLPVQASSGDGHHADEHDNDHGNGGDGDDHHHDHEHEHALPGGAAGGMFQVTFKGELEEYAARYDVGTSGDFVLYWTVDEGLGVVDVLVTSSCTGWVGIGVARTPGEMVGGQAVAGWAGGFKGDPKVYELGGMCDEDEGIRTGKPCVRENHHVTKSLSHSAMWRDEAAGVTMLKFQRPLATGDPDAGSHALLPVWTDGRATPLLLAAGSRKDMSMHNVAFVAVEARFDLGTAVTVPADKRRTAHGVLMAFVFVVIFPLTAFVARFYKHVEPTWFQLHKYGNACAVVLAAVGLALGLAAGSHTYRAHMGLGIFIFIFVCVQAAFAALCRPDKYAPSRDRWTLVHSWSGRFLYLLGVANVFVGLRVIGAGKGAYAVVIATMLLSWVAFAVRAVLVYRTRPSLNESKFESLQELDDDFSSDDGDGDAELSL